MLFHSYKVWARQFIFALVSVQGTVSSMGKVIVITSKNVNVSYKIIWGTTRNIFPSELSGQDFQTIRFVAAKDCNCFVISHMFSCQMFPQLSAIQIMSC